MCVLSMVCSLSVVCSVSQVVRHQHKELESVYKMKAGQKKKTIASGCWAKENRVSCECKRATEETEFSVKT